MISAACHKKPLLLHAVLSDYYIGLFRQPRQFCKTSAEVTNYRIAFCETMLKPGATEIVFGRLP